MDRVGVAKRFEYFTMCVKPPNGHRWVLASANPGDGRRWQIHLVNDDSGNIVRCYPRHGHWKTSDFSDYLEGMIDMADEMTRR